VSTLESNSPLLSNRSRKSLGIIPNGHKHGICQSKTSSLKDFTQPQRKIVPFRNRPANYRPPRIVRLSTPVYLQFVSQMTHKSTLV
jgi:hypothetical protein